ncbi:helix-turn-helix transcriptional regulator [Saccharothrix violaceirubra]|uniref:Putative DNA-binding transcriptional regulator YafY n=1 Tax=Saccharothrix violaceirubra TaxID=413306 RepID=A0A7W7WUN7_9PSEU|nr:WYL domain-containing protein [Saccharothrix violaceirubra]MBB4964459.1 putative DNA-binding transcriptional regulator YafY [Saccharothrix violaceirubra]
MRAGRLLSLLLLLQARGRMTAGELADELEVSVRTVYRDVEALGAAGIPVYADRGPAGGYRLLDGYRTRLTGFTSAEADSLFLAGLPGPAAELGLGAVVAAARTKLRAALPDGLRERSDRIAERFHLDAPGWFRSGESAPHLETVADAVWNRRRLWLRYRRWGSRPVEVDRVVEPLGLVLKAGTWYLVADAEGDTRTYRVSRVLDARPEKDVFERPEFDLEAFWTDWSERFEERMYPERVTVRFTAKGLARARFLLGSYPARHVPEHPTGEWTEVRVPTESLDHAVFDLLRLGTEVEVLDPPELRRRLADTAAGVAALYG